MWPFDKVLFNRVRDLERQVEIMTGANEVLTHELNRSQQREEELLEKIFNLTGVNKVKNIQETTPLRQPIEIGNRKVPWGKLRENLELKAREEYWENKKKSEGTRKDNTDVEQLEKDVIGEQGHG